MGPEEPHKMNMIFLLCLLVLVDFFCGALASRLPDCLAQGLANSLFMKDVPHIHLLDQANGNFLFRGGTPDVDGNGNFDIHALRRGLSYAAYRANVSLPNRYEIYDHNLLKLKEGSYDRTETLSEYSWFANNPNDGAFTYWPMFGCEANVSTLSTPQIDAFQKTFGDWDNDRVLDRATTLQL